MTTWGQAVSEQQAKAARLEKAAAEWEAKADVHRGNLDPGVRSYYLEKAASSRREAAKLRGEAVDEPEKVAKSRPMTVTLPR